MRVTLNIDDDVLRAAKELAAAQGKSLGEVISSLARQALGASSKLATRNGVPLLPVRSGARRVRPKLVMQLREELQ